MTDRLEVVSDPGEENCVVSGKRKRNEINYRRNVNKKNKLKALERQFHWEVCSSPYDRRTMWTVAALIAPLSPLRSNYTGVSENIDAVQVALTRLTKKWRVRKKKKGQIEQKEKQWRKEEKKVDRFKEDMKQETAWKKKRYNLSIFEDLDISQKINKYTRAMGIVNSLMKPSLVQKHTRIRLYNIFARPMLSYGSEAWTLRKADKSRITACEMRFIRRTAGYAKWDLKRNCEILKKLKTQPVLDYIVQYQSNWKHHLERMSTVVDSQRKFMIMYHMAKDLWVSC
ncbi:hypothetical protein ANN_10052 [Periplaneta americana]|uniref:Uncharacterized protein n=1 Tax=Periplaneta americana TaxID=6978 RepID=A0ABQ8TQN4_PERAM|nr:hypothetical protein ANN_10052 [Periplaneta americana]